MAHRALDDLDSILDSSSTPTVKRQPGSAKSYSKVMHPGSGQHPPRPTNDPATPGIKLMAANQNKSTMQNIARRRKAGVTPINVPSLACMRDPTFERERALEELFQAEDIGSDNGKPGSTDDNFWTIPASEDGGDMKSDSIASKSPAADPTTPLNKSQPRTRATTPGYDGSEETDVDEGITMKKYLDRVAPRGPSSYRLPKKSKHDLFAPPALHEAPSRHSKTHLMRGTSPGYADEIDEIESQGSVATTASAYEADQFADRNAIIQDGFDAMTEAIYAASEIIGDAVKSPIESLSQDVGEALRMQARAISQLTAEITALNAKHLDVVSARQKLRYDILLIAKDHNRLRGDVTRLTRENAKLVQENKRLTRVKIGI